MLGECDSIVREQVPSLIWWIKAQIVPLCPGKSGCTARPAEFAQPVEHILVRRVNAPERPTQAVVWVGVDGLAKPYAETGLPVLSHPDAPRLQHGALGVFSAFGVPGGIGERGNDEILIEAGRYSLKSPASVLRKPGKEPSGSVFSLGDLPSVRKPETRSLLIRPSELPFSARALAGDSVPDSGRCWTDSCLQVLIGAIVPVIKTRHASEITRQPQI
jgi:hypothetical protein